MKRGGGHGKGAGFERKVCVQLSLWVTGGKQRDLFWRTAMSGGRATQFRKKGIVLRQAGDITAVAPEGHVLTDRYFIECKHVKDLGLDDFLLKETGTLARFWDKVKKQAKACGLRPMLIARQNMMPTIVVTENARSPIDPASGLIHMKQIWYLGDSPCMIVLLDEMLKLKFQLEGSSHARTNGLQDPEKPSTADTRSGALGNRERPPGRGRPLRKVGRQREQRIAR